MPNTAPEPPARLVHVVAGALADAAGRILIARRPDGVHQGGLWEFPGGKVEPGEDAEQALARELAEELGIRVSASRPLIRVQHDYGDRRILLEVRRVQRYAGVPRGCEGQPLDWVHPAAMDPARFPAADRPIITALRLPSRYLITGADPSDPGRFLAQLEQALANGIRLVQLRAHGLDEPAYLRLAARCLDLCEALCENRRETRCETGTARLLLNRTPAAAARLPGVGLHLSAARLRALPARPAGLPLVGASCHDAAELARAVALGLDYALLSPVAATASHAGAPVLGWSRFAALVAPLPLPVYALGGLGAADLEPAWQHGAQGIAAISALWPAP